MDFKEYKQFYRDNGFLPNTITWNRLPEYIRGIITGESFVETVELIGNNLIFSGLGNGFNGAIDLSSLSGVSGSNIYNANGAIPNSEFRQVNLNTGSTLRFTDNGFDSYIRFSEGGDIELTNTTGSLRLRQGDSPGIINSNNVGDVWTAIDTFGGGRWQSIGSFDPSLNQDITGDWSFEGSTDLLLKNDKGLKFANTTNSFTSVIRGTNITGASRLIELPSASGTLPVSVNGNFADSSGNITVAVDSSNKYSETFGNGVATTITINHNLNAEDLTSVIIKEVSTGEHIFTTVTEIDNNNVQLDFTTAPTTNQYRITITG